MLSVDNLRRLVREIVATAEILGHDISEDAAAMMASDLAVYPVEVLAKALKRVRTEHSGKLTPKVIIDRIDESLGRPAANEAWAIASKALDETATVVWTDEMSQAWFLARPIAAGGDMIGARMAFISAYERLVRDARDARRLPVATVSLGSDAQARAPAIENAVKLGYLSPEQARRYDDAAPAAAIGWVNPVALLTGRVEEGRGAPHSATPELKERLRKLREDLATSAARRQAERMKAAEERRQAERDRKAAINAEVQRRLEEAGLQ